MGYGYLLLSAAILTQCDCLSCFQLGWSTFHGGVLRLYLILMKSAWAILVLDPSWAFWALAILALPLLLNLEELGAAKAGRSEAPLTEKQCPLSAVTR